MKISDSVKRVGVGVYWIGVAITVWAVWIVIVCLIVLVAKPVFDAFWLH